MKPDRHGKEWTKKEDKKLIKLFNEGNSFLQMGKQLNRTWFACKCRLARLGLIEPFERNIEDFFIGALEPHRVPNIQKASEKIGKIMREVGFGCEEYEKEFYDSSLSHVDSEDTSNTFSTTELNIVTDYLKTRLSKVMCELADGSFCFVRDVELNAVKELLETEIKVANSMKKISVRERERVLKRLC